MKYRIHCASPDTGREMVVELDAAGSHDAEEVVASLGLLVGQIRECSADTASSRSWSVPACKQIAVASVVLGVAGIVTPLAGSPQSMWLVYGFKSGIAWSILATVVVSMWILGVFAPLRRPRASHVAPALVIATIAIAGQAAFMHYIVTDFDPIRTMHLMVGAYLTLASCVVAAVSAVAAIITAPKYAPRQTAFGA